MGSAVAFPHIFSQSSSSSLGILNSAPSQYLLKPPKIFIQNSLFCGTPLITHTSHLFLKTPITITTRATLDEKEASISAPAFVQEEDEEEGKQVPNEVCFTIYSHPFYCLTFCNLITLCTTYLTHKYEDQVMMQWYSCYCLRVPSPWGRCIMNASLMDYVVLSYRKWRGV